MADPENEYVPKWGTSGDDEEDDFDDSASEDETAPFAANEANKQLDKAVLRLFVSLLPVLTDLANRSSSLRRSSCKSKQTWNSNRTASR